jgi:hypothetical protein
MKRGANTPEAKAAAERSHPAHRERLSGCCGPSTKRTRPRIVDMTKDFSEAVNEWRKSGFKVVTDEQFESRHKVCKQCEFYKGQAFMNTGQCLKCGCSIRAKLRLSTSKCPIDKWGPEEFYAKPTTNTDGDNNSNPAAAS